MRPGTATAGLGSYFCERQAMPRPDKPKEPERVQCGACRKEVPRSEALVPEAQDYLFHFCGKECYEKWKKERPQAT